VLRTVLWRILELLAQRCVRRGRVTAGPRALDRAGLDAISRDTQKALGRRGDDAAVDRLQIGGERRARARGQRAQSGRRSPATSGASASSWRDRLTWYTSPAWM
jgi:hypothetical protein